ncbi:MAG: hypothetical protein ACUVQ3_03750 [bacterium]
MYKTYISDKEELKSGVSVVVPKEAESRSIFARKDMMILAVQVKVKGILL